jgi:hypothetical protein
MSSGLRVSAYMLPNVFRAFRHERSPFLDSRNSDIPRTAHPDRALVRELATALAKRSLGSLVPAPVTCCWMTIAVAVRLDPGSQSQGRDPPVL